MKKFSYKINEAAAINDTNPGNGLNRGVMNHYTPVENIVTNLKNLFAVRESVVVSVAEDGCSIKLESSRFSTKEKTYAIMNKIIYNDGTTAAQSMASYIRAQGLDRMTLVNIGQTFLVYCSASDLAQAGHVDAGMMPNESISELHEAELDDFNTYIFENDDDEELKDPKVVKIGKILKSKDKVKSAKELEALVAKEMDLPDEYYFAGVRDKEGFESIALRWRAQHRRPHGKTAEVTYSLMNVYGTGDDAVWVSMYDDDSIMKPTHEMKTLIDNLIELLGAEKTSDPCIFSIGEDDTKKSPKDTEKEPVENPNEVEDDASRDDDENDN